MAPLKFHLRRALQSLGSLCSHPKKIVTEETPEEESHEESLKMVCGAFYIPKDDPLNPRGDDAYFVSKEKQAIGVADGVGSWAAARGVDAGEYARELMINASAAVHQQPDGVADVKSVLNKAFLNTNAKGSSTACIGMLGNDNILRFVNVGHCGFMIFRANTVAYQSPIQQHSFNSKGCDRPYSGVETSVAVVAGDIVVLGTDGLSDNVNPADIEDVLNRETLEGVNPMELALSIANLAWSNSLDRTRDRPFATATLSVGPRHVERRIDDITVVVAHIVPQNCMQYI
ncbi:probable protein phosphatase 2C 55 [Corylus avellana]|uniref:probable protein phosphatase 2C 55 n=1 Tax=Corylus avellana TaxID=13451 RepID=UPI00286A3E8E|nr:probable protein phosphatase 2C 55 [Corylus avellana]